MRKECSTQLPGDCITKFIRSCMKGGAQPSPWMSIDPRWLPALIVWRVAAQITEASKVSNTTEQTEQFPILTKDIPIREVEQVGV